MNANDFAENTMLDTQSDSLMDVDYLDELLLEGCWLETSNGSEFLHQSPSSFSALFDASCPRPTLEVNNGDSSALIVSQEERQRLFFSDNLSISKPREKTSPKWEYRAGNLGKALCTSGHSGSSVAESPDLSRRWWIEPSASTSVMDRLIKAIGYIKDWSGDNKNVLVQIWVPVNRGGRRVLTTNDQPFSIDRCNPGLAHYRDISVKYQFATEEDSKECVGFPGRVYVGKVPEWTPDVQFYARNEYPRVGHAQQYDVRGALGVPIFERGSRHCLGVIEVVLTTQKINYRPELENVCKALKAVDLGSVDVPSAGNIEVRDFSHESALPEILDIFREACGTYNLPLAQAWVPCIVQGKGGCRHSDENLVLCVSPVDSACYIADPRTQGFNEACLDHHLLKGQGIVGRAFTTNEPCFSPDVTTFTKRDYPLSHHARMFGLCAAVAIRLRSIHSCSTDFVLEFFLPVDCKDSKEHMDMLSSLSLIIQKVCRGLRVITDEELQEETLLPIVEVPVPSFIKSTEEMPKMEHKLSTMASDKMSSWTSTSVEAEECAGIASEVHSGKTTKVLSGKFLESMQYQSDMSSGNEIVFGDSLTASGHCSLLNVSTNGEKRRAKVEKTITLEILRQHFAGSLKDAAKSIGVCPTTLKRICRQHGIKRWPSRKIKKVGHSLQKIQRVIDSVEGASGSLQIGSFYTNFPELAAPKIVRTDPFPSLQLSDHHTKPLNVQPQGCTLSPHISASKSPSSSCGHSSSSSQCHSTGRQQHSQTVYLSGQENSAIKDNLDGLPLKRVRSDAQLHLSSDEPRPMQRSQSHASFMEHPKSEEFPLVPPETLPCSQEGSRNTLRIKATYGEEKIRLRMLEGWGYRDLMGEIVKRFGINDTSGLYLKYLDDDFEWILLTCDADLEECVDVYQSARSQTIKLSLVRDSQSMQGSSSGRTHM